MTKICRNCNISLNCEEHFYKNKSAKDGFRNTCKKCSCHAKEIFYNQNKEKIKDYKKQYRLHNVDKVNKITLKYIKNRLKNDNLFKLEHNIRALIYHSLKNNGVSKHTKTATLLGITSQEFKVHIETQFGPDMTWDNYGSYWSIDHICPCSQSQNEQELIKLQCYINLRPMVHYGPNGNLIKSNNKTLEAQDMCHKLLNRTWIE